MQHLYIIRHGDRFDYANPEKWRRDALRVHDPPLSDLGHVQARETGQKMFLLLEELDSFHNVGDDKPLSLKQEIVFLSSPFVRCLQTSTQILSQIDNDNVQIKLELSVSELDGKNGARHNQLPPSKERHAYFPRVDIEYDSVHVPDFPESFPEGFIARCNRGMDIISGAFPYKPNSAIIVVTHAASCIALTAAAAGIPIEEVNAASPCSIYRLKRKHKDQVHWQLDHHSDKTGYNGYADHLSFIAEHTPAWHHFAPNEGYTGPSSPVKKNDVSVTPSSSRQSK